jgi:hypothetical protein
MKPLKKNKSKTQKHNRFKKTTKEFAREFEEDDLTMGPEEFIEKYQLDGVDDIF